ncbi:MAG: hypothetical protein KF867_07945 [Cryobacterium sp.]|nr:hypothetical protein [Cryobacterium sp.]MBX3104893.1 hypothetical protein [Cryobacterium sp.]
MRVPRRDLFSSAIVALATLCVLSACAGTKAPEGKPTGLPTQAPTETKTPEPDPMADVLFTITANVRAADGRTIGISMAAHTPLDSTNSKAADLRTKFISVCADSSGSQPIDENYLRDNGSTLMKIELTSSAPNLTFAAPVLLHFGSQYYAHAAVGDGVAPEPGGNHCYYGYDWVKSGTAVGIADFENPDGIPDPKQWTFGFYGFSVDPSSGATIEACRVNLTDLTSSYQLADIPGWDPALAGDGISCVIGYQGE